MTDVILHIYDVTNTGSDKTNSTIVQINKIFKDGTGLDGIFHSAIQDGSVSYCEKSWDSSHEEEVSPQGLMLVLLLFLFVVYMIGALQAHLAPSGYLKLPNLSTE
ncbi:hypothetical protein CRYUN_Cryun02cG0108200 [Craigia yunnanensis]